MPLNTPVLEPIFSSLERMGMEVGVTTLPVGARHFHISAPDPQSSLVLAIPIEITDNSGVAHVLEHLLLTGSKKHGEDGLFFRTRASSSAVDMNAITNSRYLVVHFTCEDAEEYFLLLHTFTKALFEPNWSGTQLAREIATITNEMEGALSDINFNWQLVTYRSLFDEGSSQYNPGGDPSCIAEVDQERLLKFWEDHFSPNNLIAVSYGSQAGDVITKQLSLSLSQFDSGCDKAIALSEVIESPRTLHWYDSCERGLQGQSAGALMIDSNADEDKYFDTALIESFVVQYESDICASLAQTRLHLDMPVSLRYIDGDSFLFLLFKSNEIVDSKKVWDQVAAVCEAIIGRLSKPALKRLVHQALANYFTLGNHKFGTGVAASLELLNAVCGSPTVGQRHKEMIEIENTINQFNSHSSWLTLFQTHIRMNGRQTLVICDPSNASEKLPSLGACCDENTVDSKPSVAKVMRKVNTSTQPDLSQRSSETYSLGWVVPKISENKNTTIFHYRIPRPWISRLKLSIPLPKDLIEEVGLSSQFSLPELPELDSLGQQLQSSVSVSKVPGVSAYRLYLSISATADVVDIRKLLQILSSSVSSKRLAQSVNHWHISDVGVRSPLPLHKLAIYRCAAQLSEIARVQLALTGYGESDNAASASWRLRHEELSTLGLQPKSILFMDSWFEKDEISLNEFNAEASVARHSDFVDIATSSYLANTDRQESIPGVLNYCARVWTLGKRFGVAVDEDVIPHVFSALATNLFLEPVLRSERSAYAASAEIDSELGMLVMFSYRDPNSTQTDTFFVKTFEQVITGNYDTIGFEQSKKRAISRLQNKGSYDQRCEQQFDQIVKGYRPDYYEALKNAIATIDLFTFQKKLTSFFEEAQTADYALTGSNSARAE